jgi:hypothetical protein
MEALEAENHIMFAMENPAHSDLWEMPEVKSRIQDQSLNWRLVQVDQCAYGRKCKKPTRILTNIMNWEPKGLTGNGRCKILKCGGTSMNKAGPGQGKHEQQMISKDPARKPREGERMGQGNRREYSVKAGKNLVRAELVQEIVRAAVASKKEVEQGKKRKR